MLSLNQAIRSTQSLAKQRLRRRACSIGRVAMVIVFVVLGCRPAVAQVPGQSEVINREYTIKAAFLYHFLTYIEWPPSNLPAPDQPFVIGIYQSNPFGTSLEKIARTKTIAGHPIEVRLIHSAQEVRQCHILFVPESVPPSQWNAVLRAERRSHVLVVGEVDDFVEQGGDAQFFVEGNKVRFAFSERTAKSEEHKVSSKLLALAKIVPGK